MYIYYYHCTSLHCCYCVLVGERLVSESFASVIESADDSCKNVLTQLYHLHLLSVIENNLGPLILSGKYSSLWDQESDLSPNQGVTGGSHIIILWFSCLFAILEGFVFSKDKHSMVSGISETFLAKIPVHGHSDWFFSRVLDQRSCSNL